MRVINDPLGQTHRPPSCDHYARLNFVLFCKILKSGDGRTDGQTTRAKIVITTGRDCGSASWSQKYCLPQTGSALWVFRLEVKLWILSKLKRTRQVSSMIHSARPTFSPVTNIAFAWNLFCFEKVRTDDMCKNNDHYWPWLWVGLVDQ